MKARLSNTELVLKEHTRWRGVQRNSPPKSGWFLKHVYICPVYDGHGHDGEDQKWEHKWNGSPNEGQLKHTPRGAHPALQPRVSIPSPAPHHLLNPTSGKTLDTIKSELFHTLYHLIWRTSLQFRPLLPTMEGIGQPLPSSWAFVQPLPGLAAKPKGSLPQGSDPAP